MPLDLRALNRGFGECEIEFGGETITLRFRADLKLKQMIRIQTAVIKPPGPDGQAQQPDIRAMVEILQEILLESGPEVPADERGWDLTQGGEPVPTTFDELAELPMDLLNAMISGVFTEINNPNRRRLSRRGSSPRADSAPAPSPTTGDSSTTPNGQASLRGPSPDSRTPLVIGAAGESGFGP